MSVNRYDASTGELTNIASGQRTWVGTQAAYKAAKQAGTLPNNAIIAITDDEQDHNHYSTDEVKTGMYWIDGKPIYRKVVDIGALPNNAQKTVLHGITNADTFIKVDAFAQNTNGTAMQLPFFSIDDTSKIVLWKTSANILIKSNYDASGLSGYAIIEYTKTTD